MEQKSGEHRHADGTAHTHPYEEPKNGALHSHQHVHPDGTKHEHEHTHDSEHDHVHHGHK